MKHLMGGKDAADVAAWAHKAHKDRLDSFDSLLDSEMFDRVVFVLDPLDPLDSCLGVTLCPMWLPSCLPSCHPKLKSCQLLPSVKDPPLRAAQTWQVNKKYPWTTELHFQRQPSTRHNLAQATVAVNCSRISRPMLNGRFGETLAVAVPKTSQESGFGPRFHSHLAIGSHGNPPFDLQSVFGS